MDTRRDQAQEINGAAALVAAVRDEAHMAAVAAAAEVVGALVVHAEWRISELMNKVSSNLPPLSSPSSTYLMCMHSLLRWPSRLWIMLWRLILPILLLSWNHYHNRLGIWNIPHLARDYRCLVNAEFFQVFSGLARPPHPYFQRCGF